MPAAASATHATVARILSGLHRGRRRRSRRRASRGSEDPRPTIRLLIGRPRPSPPDHGAGGRGDRSLTVSDPADTDWIVPRDHGQGFGLAGLGSRTHPRPISDCRPFDQPPPTCVLARRLQAPACALDSAARGVPSALLLTASVAIAVAVICTGSGNGPSSADVSVRGSMLRPAATFDFGLPRQLVRAVAPARSADLPSGPSPAISNPTCTIARSSFSARPARARCFQTSSAVAVRVRCCSSARSQSPDLG